MNRLDDTSGFAVVELLITLVIIGTVFGAFMTAFVSINTIIKKGNDIDSANYAAFSKMQEYENKSFSNLQTTSPLNTLVEVEDFSASLSATLPKPAIGKVYISTVSTTLRQIDVQVKFGSGDGQQIVEYGNFIQRNGIGR